MNSKVMPESETDATTGNSNAEQEVQKETPSHEEITKSNDIDTVFRNICLDPETTHVKSEESMIVKGSGNPEWERRFGGLVRLK